MAMGIEVAEAKTNRIVLAVPLAPNVNHHKTAFGGSISAAATLACWALLHLRLNDSSIDASLVIHKHKIIYRKPITGNFEAICELSDENRWSDFVTQLDQNQKSKIILKSQLLYNSECVGELTGSFVALKACE